MLGPVLAHPPVMIASIAVVIGGLAFWYKRSWLLGYGLTEVGFGVATAYQVALGSHSANVVIAKWTALGSSVYVISRGLNNVADAIKKLRTRVLKDEAGNVMSVAEWNRRKFATQELTWRREQALVGGYEEHLGQSASAQTKQRGAEDSCASSRSAECLQAAGLSSNERGHQVELPDADKGVSDRIPPEDVVGGTIYVLQSVSRKPEIAVLRGVLHKICVTPGTVEDSTLKAEHYSDSLFAPVEVVATWQLANSSRLRFEQTVYRVLGATQVQLIGIDWIGTPSEPHSWFVVSLPIIGEVVERINNGSIVDFYYDAMSASLQELGSRQKTDNKAR